MSTPATNPPARRRAAAAGPGGRAVLLGFMLVALTAGMLTLAGTTPRGIGAPVEKPSRVVLDQRSFVCDARIPGSQVVRGSIVGGPGRTVSTSAPTTIEAERDVAGGAFAAESARSKRWAAWQSCPEAHARWWFLGAGGAAVTHDTVLVVTNPREGAAVLDVDVFGRTGQIDAPGLHGLTLAGGATQTFDVAKIAPAIGELGVRIIARRGLVTVSAADSFSPGGVGKEVREWLPSTSVPAITTTLTGLPAKVTGATLLVANPGPIEALVDVSVVGATGTFKPEGMEPVSVPPESVASIPVTSLFDGEPMALQVTGSRPVTATVRATRNGDIAFAAGAPLLRGSTGVAVPSGNGRQLVLSALREDGSVTVTGYDAAAKQILERTIAVKGGTSVAVKLGAKVTYLRVVTTTPGIVAGYVAELKRGLSTGVVAPALRSTRLPGVRADW